MPRSGGRRTALGQPDSWLKHLNGMEGQQRKECSLVRGSWECGRAGSPCQHCRLQQPGTPATPERPAPPALACRLCLQAHNELAVTDAVTQTLCSTGLLPMPARDGTAVGGQMSQSLVQYWPAAWGRRHSKIRRSTRWALDYSAAPACCPHLPPHMQEHWHKVVRERVAISD